MWRLVAGLERFVLAAFDFVVHCCNINGRARSEETKMFFKVPCPRTARGKQALETYLSNVTNAACLTKCSNAHQGPQCAAIELFFSNALAGLICPGVSLCHLMCRDIQFDGCWAGFYRRLI